MRSAILLAACCAVSACSSLSWDHVGESANEAARSPWVWGPLAGAAVLEPVSLLTVNVPEGHQGDVLGDLNARRGRMMNLEKEAEGLLDGLLKVGAK